MKMPKPHPQYLVRDRLAVEIHPDRLAMGRAAARAVAAFLRDTLAAQGAARVVFGCAPSQDEFIASLTAPEACGVDLDWGRLTVFHIDDYVGLAGDHPQSFRHYLQEHLLARVKVGRFHPIPAERPDRAGVCTDYAALLAEKPIDLICLGIGENGHIAFNDPQVAEFDDPSPVKVVELDALCRAQQVNDGCFASLDQVPGQAYTLTVPVFRQARRLSIHVPGPRKAKAVQATLLGPVAPTCPASILRLHPHATLYLDADSAGRIQS
jgi:glucosamine-6-phosphate deaminase